MSSRRLDFIDHLKSGSILTSRTGAEQSAEVARAPAALRSSMNSVFFSLAGDNELCEGGIIVCR